MQVSLFSEIPGHYRLQAGVDEAGRGPWAGPVCAAAVLLDPAHPIAGLADSKKLTASTRERLAEHIKLHALSWSVAWATVQEIDTLNILQATFLAMRRAVHGLDTSPDHVIVDGNKIPPGLPCPATALIKGDNLEPAVSAASILAKTARDQLCLQLHELYPGYGFDQHKGYGTALHQQRLQALGPCPEHRTSFAPVKRALMQTQRLSHGTTE